MKVTYAENMAISPCAKFTTPVTTYAWPSNIDFRVRAVDSLKVTSAWSAVSTLTVLQPATILTFTPAVVVQSQQSVLSASATNGTAPFTYTYQWRWTGSTSAWVEDAAADARRRRHERTEAAR